MKKILYIVNRPRFFVSHRLDLGVAMRNRGHKVAVAAPGKQLTDLGNLGFEFLPLEMSRKGMNPLKEVFGLWAFIKLFQKWRPDLVHAVSLKPYFYASLAARFTGVPQVVCAVSGLGNFFTQKNLKNTLALFFLRPVFRFAFSHPRQLFLFQNSADLEAMTTLGLVKKERTFLITGGSGVNLEQFHLYPLDQKPKRLCAVFAARLLFDKGISEFIEAAKILRTKGYDWRFLVVGDPDLGNPASVTLEDIERWKKEGIVEFLGHQTKMSELFQQAHLCVLPSYREGLPKVVLEAQACGLPVVTTDVPGCRDAIVPHQTGLLAKVQSGPDLAQAMEKILGDEKLRASMSAKARDFIEQNCTVEHVIEQHKKAYALLD